MGELKDLELGGAEIFVRTNKKVLRLELPADLVKELEEMQGQMKADDILEVLVKSAKNMMKTLHSLKTGNYEYEDDKGRKCKVSTE